MGRRLTRVLGMHGSVPLSPVLCTRGPLGSGEESSRGPSWVGSSVTGALPRPPRWTCSRSSWAPRVGSTSATSCGTASRPLRRFRPSRCSGRRARFLHTLRSLFYFEFPIKGRCILRQIREFGFRILKTKLDVSGRMAAVVIWLRFR